MVVGQRREMKESEFYRRGREERRGRGIWGGGEDGEEGRRGESGRDGERGGDGESKAVNLRGQGVGGPRQHSLSSKDLNIKKGGLREQVRKWHCFASEGSNSACG